MLYYDSVEDQVVPCIAPLLAAPRHAPLRRALGHFPVLSWREALRLLDDLPVKERFIFVLVNDWQYCPAGAQRAAFYDRYTKLPDVFEAMLMSRRTSPRLLRPSKSSTGAGLFFSEQALRNQYQRRIKRMIADGTLPPDVQVQKHDRGLTCSIDDLLGRHEEIFCAGKGANCTGEVAELVRQVSDLTRCDLFINLFPSVCREFVIAGTELSARLFSPTVRTVINVALPAAELSENDDLWEATRIAIHTLERVQR